MVLMMRIFSMSDDETDSIVGGYCTFRGVR